MPAKDQTTLLAVTEKEYTKLKTLIADLSVSQALSKDAEDTSIKDVVAHRAHWITLFLNWYHDGLAGREVHFPAKGYKWSDLKAYNAALRDTQKELNWSDACTQLEAQYAALITFLKNASDETLYAGPMKGAKNHWTPGRWAEAAGPSHFRSASKYIRLRLKELGPA